MVQERAESSAVGSKTFADHRDCHHSLPAQALEAVGQISLTLPCVWALPFAASSCSSGSVSLSAHCSRLFSSNSCLFLTPNLAPGSLTFLPFPHPYSQPIHLVQPVPVFSHLPRAIVSSFHCAFSSSLFPGSPELASSPFGPSTCLWPFWPISVTGL